MFKYDFSFLPSYIPHVAWLSYWGLYLFNNKMKEYVDKRTKIADGWMMVSFLIAVFFQIMILIYVKNK